MKSFQEFLNEASDEQHVGSDKMGNHIMASKSGHSVRVVHPKTGNTVAEWPNHMVAHAGRTKENQSKAVEYAKKASDKSDYWDYSGAVHTRWHNSGNKD